MDELMLIVSVATLFVIRIGVPVVLLIGLGIMIDQWQRHHNHRA
jgi:hypothetical protein